MAGFHVPVMPLTEVLGSAGTGEPAQIELIVPKLKVGVTTAFTVTLKFVVVAH
jgi:hypothetical protein